MIQYTEAIRNDLKRDQRYQNARTAIIDIKMPKAVILSHPGVIGVLYWQWPS